MHLSWKPTQCSPGKNDGELEVTVPYGAGVFLGPVVHASHFGCGVFCHAAPSRGWQQHWDGELGAQHLPTAGLSVGEGTHLCPRAQPPQAPSLSLCPCVTSATRLNQICAESHCFHGNVKESEDPKPPGGAAVGGSDALWTTLGSPTAPCSAPIPEPLVGPCSP